MEKEVVPFTVTPNDPVGNFFLSVPASLNSGGLGVWVPEREILQLEATAISPLKWKLRLPPGHFGLLMP